MSPSVGLGHHLLFGTAGETSIHPAVLAALVAAIILMSVMPRKYAVLPLLLLSLLLPMGQVLMIGTVHLQVFRILVIFGWMRLLWQRYVSEGRAARVRLNSVDKAVIFYAISSVVCYTLLWQRSEAFKGELGTMYNVLGFYFIFRAFIRDQNDVERVIKAMAVIALIIAACMLNEQITGHNLLAALGGVPELASVREGYVRSQGPFRVYLTAGAFGATLLPLFLCLWRSGGSRMLALLGIVGAITITITSRTSTAISACLATVVALGLWPLRDKLHVVRRGLVGTLVTLHLCMKSPVWALIARIDLVGGSTGWHRFKIIDNFVRHFWDWWLLGSNNYWIWEGGDDMWDTANQYVYTGENTGLLSLIFFLTAIVYCFKYVGNARKAAGHDSRRAWFLWLLGVALFSNLVVFLGISYFDQTFIYWYALLAMIVAAASAGTAAVPVIYKSRPRELWRWQAEPEGFGSFLDARPSDQGAGGSYPVEFTSSRSQ